MRLWKFRNTARRAESGPEPLAPLNPYMIFGRVEKSSIISMGIRRSSIIVLMYTDIKWYSPHLLNVCA